MARLTAKEIISHLKLEPLDQEGGYFRRIFTSTHTIDSGRGKRPAGTAIQFLLTRESFSAMHRLRSLETWFFHFGDPVELLLLHPEAGETVTLGHDLAADQRVHLTCPAQVWQGARLLESADAFGYALCSTMVCPGFEWEDFELGSATILTDAYPRWKDAILARVR